MRKHVDSKHLHCSKHSSQHALCSSTPYTQETEPNSSEPHGSCKLFHLWYLFWTMGYDFKVGPSLTKNISIRFIMERSHHNCFIRIAFLCQRQTTPEFQIAHRFVLNGELLSCLPICLI
uniref:Uncharacterized protein n=1 Tax=Anser cygnoides TaxID=8845 RepID=A0A8B9E5P3_ANSCY